MAKEIIMPKMGNTVESVIIGEINIKVGDQISKGDILFDYETDKSTSEYKAEESGEVLLLLMEPGEEIPVLAPIIIIGNKKDDISKWEKLKQEKRDQDIVNKDNEIATPIQDHDEGNASLNEARFNAEKVSPRAKKVADEFGVDISKIPTATGIGGRLVEADVLNFYHADQKSVLSPIAPANLPLSNSGEFEKIAYTGMRKAIANIMASSLAGSAQLTMGATFDATEILKLRKYIKENYKKLGLVNSSINDLFVFALSRVLPRFPQINSIIGDDCYYAYNVAHISIAVDVPSGLLVPVIRNASKLTLGEISLQSQELIRKAKVGKLTGKDQAGGTFTISNLGLSGVSFFTPILNAPQSALLGIGSPQKRLRLNENKEIEEYKEIMLSLTMDHRPYDGARGAEFLHELVKVLENIEGLLI